MDFAVCCHVFCLRQILSCKFSQITSDGLGQYVHIGTDSTAAFDNEDDLSIFMF